METYQQTDSEYLKAENSQQHRDAGSTASTAVLVGDRLLVANVGDSRAVICRAGQGKTGSHGQFLNQHVPSFPLPRKNLPLVMQNGQMVL